MTPSQFSLKHGEQSGFFTFSIGILVADDVFSGKVRLAFRFPGVRGFFGIPSVLVLLY